MSFLDLIRWSLRQIRVRLLESVLIILGIALGVAVITGAVGLTENFQKQANSTMQRIDMRVLYLRAAQDDYYQANGLPFRRVGRAGEEQIMLSYKDYQAIREAKIPGIKYIWAASSRGEMRPEGRPMEEGNMPTTYEEHRKWEDENMIRYLLVSPEALDVAGITLVKGDTIREADVVNKSKVALIGDELARKMFGDADPVGQTVKLQMGELTVIGVIHREDKTSSATGSLVYIQGIGDLNTLNNSVIIPLFSYGFQSAMKEEAEQDVLREGIYLLPVENVPIEQVVAQVQSYVEEMYGESITVTGSFRFEKENRKSVLAITQAIGILACAALLIAAINILNLMLARVLRRTKQIGISRAVGGSKGDIFRLFLAESLLLGIIGSVIGIGMGYGALQLLSKLVQQQLNLTPLTYIVGFGCALFTSLIFGLYPASQAANAHPADALKKD